MVELFGPASGEGPARRYGPVRRVAVLSDVHANTPALEAGAGRDERRRPGRVLRRPDLGPGAGPYCVGDPSAEIIAGMLTEPYSPDRITTEAEELVFTD